MQKKAAEIATMDESKKGVEQEQSLVSAAVGGITTTQTQNTRTQTQPQLTPPSTAQARDSPATPPPPSIDGAKEVALTVQQSYSPHSAPEVPADADAQNADASSHASRSGRGSIRLPPLTSPKSTTEARLSATGVPPIAEDSPANALPGSVTFHVATDDV